MATITAVAAGGNWNATGTWSPAQIPTAADDVILNATSGQVTIPTATTALCRSLDCTGYTNTLTMTGALTVGTTTAGFLKLSATMTRTGTGAVTLTSTGGGTVTSAGKVWTNSFTLSGGGVWTLQDDLTSGAGNTFQMLGGTIDLNGHTLQIGTFTATTGTCVITFGAGTLTLLQSNSTVLNWSGSTLTVNAGTGTVSCAQNGATMNFASKTIFALVLTGGATQTITSLGGVTNLTYTPPTSTTAKTSLALTNDFAVTGTLTVTGPDQTLRATVKSQTGGTSRTITAAAVALTDVLFFDIVGAGAASPWTGTRISTVWHCSGITQSTPATSYYVGGTGNVGDPTKWASASGGTSGTGRVPLPQDTGIIDDNSGASGMTATLNNPDIGGIDCSARTVSMSLSTSQSFGNNTIVYGDLKASSAVSLTSNIGITMASASNQTLDLAGKTLASALTIGLGGIPNWTNATVTSVGSFTTTSASGVNLSGGTFAVQADFTTTQFASAGSATRTLQVDPGVTISLTATSGTPWSASATLTMAMDDTAAIAFTSTTATGRIFAGAGLSYGILRYVIAGSTGGLTITGANSFASIEFSDLSNTRTLTLPSTTTTTVRSDWKVNGTSGKLMAIASSTSGTTATLNYTGTGQLHSDYVSLKDSTASPANTWRYRANNSTIVSNVSGWLADVPAGPQLGRQCAVARAASW